MAELTRLGDRQAIGVAGLLPRHLYSYDIVLYEFRIDRALSTTWTTPTNPLHRHWAFGETGTRPSR